MKLPKDRPIFPALRLQYKAQEERIRQCGCYARWKFDYPTLEGSVYSKRFG